MPEDNMHIAPTYQTVGNLFHYRGVFNVAKYQRSYRWGEEEVSDFIDDIFNCRNARVNVNPYSHFFGGIVSVEHTKSGTSHRHDYELVDGQQRIVTFVMLVNKLIGLYNEFAYDVADTDPDLASLLRKRVEDLKSRYIRFQEEVNRLRKYKDRISLSKKDDIFFKDMLSNRDAEPQIDSQKRLKRAYSYIEERLRGLLTYEMTVEEKLDEIEPIGKVIEEDSTLIHIITQKKKVAYRLFQVLNDRGISLTEGDLLRARTLELLDSPGYETQQDAVERAWDKILIDPPGETERYLRWIYASYSGTRPGRSDLFEDFLDEFYSYHSQYPEYVNDQINAKHAKDIVDTTKRLTTEFERCRYLISGDWPFTSLDNSLTPWHTDRLNVLMSELRHTNCMPLLLSACDLDQSKFYRLVDLIERFYFRYKITCNLHIGSLNNTYQRQSKEIRDQGKSYDIDMFRSELKELQSQKATDELFRSLIGDTLDYSGSSSKKPIKYFLLSVEYFQRWIEDGADGDPEAYDETRVFDFSATTVEHVYPQNPSEVDCDLKERVHKIGNLTILGPSDNRSTGNASFDEKRELLQKSAISLNNRLAENHEWTADVVDNRGATLAEHAEAIFKIK